MLYHLSNEELNTLSPRVPDNFMTKNGYEDNIVPRVCFSKSIDGCLMGMSMKLTGKKFYVYIVNEDKMNAKDFRDPSILETPDAEITQEVWVLISVSLKCIGKIKVISDMDAPGIKYKYGNNIAELYKWKWEWI